MNSFFTRNSVLLLHLSFWVFYLSYRFYDIQEYLGYERSLYYLSIPTGFAVLASYIHYFFILPRNFGKRNFVGYSVQVILLIVIVVVARIGIENEFFPRIMATEKYYQQVKLSRIISTTWDITGFVLFTGMIKFTLEWFTLENKKKQLENEKLISELNYLKAQINPHFLFNTLHNLNYLVYSGSSKATEVIIKLSNIMRYMIYDANKEMVLLSKEVEYINDYIDLERLRLNKAFDLSFEIKGRIEGVYVAPLIMLTFLENAFKHGVSDSEDKCYIDVVLTIDISTLIFTVRNKKLKSPGTNTRSGFGLANVTKRLHLSYPDKHHLGISETEENYQVQLTLERT